MQHFYVQKSISKSKLQDVYLKLSYNWGQLNIILFLKNENKFHRSWINITVFKIKSYVFTEKKMKFHFWKLDNSDLLLLSNLTKMYL